MKRVYSIGSYRMAHPHKAHCVYCNKSTTRHEGLLGHPICSKCSRKYGENKRTKVK